MGLSEIKCLEEETQKARTTGLKERDTAQLVLVPLGPSVERRWRPEIATASGEGQGKGWNDDQAEMKSLLRPPTIRSSLSSSLEADPNTNLIRTFPTIINSRTARSHL